MHTNATLPSLVGCDESTAAEPAFKFLTILDMFPRMSEVGFRLSRQISLGISSLQQNLPDHGLHSHSSFNGASIQNGESDAELH